MKTSISAHANHKVSDYLGGLVDVDTALFSDATASVSLGGLLGSAGTKSRDHYECLIIPVSSW